jgi:hypothetical protein
MRVFVTVGITGTETSRRAVTNARKATRTRPATMTASTRSCRARRCSTLALEVRPHGLLGGRLDPRRALLRDTGESDYLRGLVAALGASLAVSNHRRGGRLGLDRGLLCL